MKRLLVASLALALSACGAPVPQSAGTIATSARLTVERVQAGYENARMWADLMLPLLTPQRAAQVRLALGIAYRAITAARIATTAADQIAQLAIADHATKRADAALPN